MAVVEKKCGKQIASVGADAWGVDFVLFDKQDEILGQPFQYRDRRTEGLMAGAYRKVPRSETSGLTAATSGILRWTASASARVMALALPRPEFTPAGFFAADEYTLPAQFYRVKLGPPLS